MENKKYLLIIEGEKYKIAKDEKTKDNFLKAYAEKEKNRGVLNTDKWLDEMLTYGYSQHYNPVGDLVVPFEDETDFEVIE